MTARLSILSLGLLAAACAHSPASPPSSGPEGAEPPAIAEPDAPPAPDAALLRGACEAGDAEACHTAALAYRDGAGVPQDVGAAAALLGVACQRELAVACNDLGMLYIRGAIPAPEPGAGIQLVGQACDGGYATACANLGYVYHHGLGVDADGEAATRLYTQGCDLGDGRACTNLGLSLLSKEEGVIQRDPQAGIEALGKGCHAGDVSGCAAAGLYWAQGGEGDIPLLSQAIPFFEAVCGEQKACTEVEGGLTLPVATKRVTPVFPTIAKEKNIREARMEYLIFVDERGQVVWIEVIRGSSIYDQAVVDALKLWRYEPAQLQGAPIGWVSRQKIIFKLEP